MLGPPDRGLALALREDDAAGDRKDRADTSEAPADAGQQVGPLALREGRVDVVLDVIALGGHHPLAHRLVVVGAQGLDVVAQAPALDPKGDADRGAADQQGTAGAQENCAGDLLPLAGVDLGERRRLGLELGLGLGLGLLSLLDQGLDLVDLWLHVGGVAERRIGLERDDEFLEGDLRLVEVLHLLALVVPVSVGLADVVEHQGVTGALVRLIHLLDGAAEETVGVVRLSLFVELLGVRSLRLRGRGHGEAAGADGRCEREMKWGSHTTAAAYGERAWLA